MSARVRGRALGALSLAALLGTACRVDQTAEVAEYRTVLDAGLPLLEEPGTGALGVREAMRLANARNESLAIEGEAYLRALVDRRRAAAQWLPIVRLSPT